VEVETEMNGRRLLLCHYLCLQNRRVAFVDDEEVATVYKRFAMRVVACCTTKAILGTRNIGITACNTSTV